MSYGEKIKQWFLYDGEDEDLDYDVIERNKDQKTSVFEKVKDQKTSNAVKALDASKDSHLMIFEPRVYGDGQEVAAHLLQKNAAVVNLHRLQKEQSKRVIDFLSGVIYAIDGDIQVIAPKTFLCTPQNVGVTGSIDFDDVDGE